MPSTLLKKSRSRSNGKIDSELDVESSVKSSRKETSVSPFREILVESTFVLLPAYVGNSSRGIFEILNSRLLSYDERLNGVLLAYSNVTLEEPNGKLFCDIPEIEYRVSFKALLLTATPGIRLEAVISHVSSGHITLLYAGVFQVIVQSHRIHSRYEYNGESNSFFSKDDSTDVLQLEKFARFEIIEFVGEGSSFHIEGSMQAESLGFAIPHLKSRKHKKKKAKSVVNIV